MLLAVEVLRKKGYGRTDAYFSSACEVLQHQRVLTYLFTQTIPAVGPHASTSGANAPGGCKFCEKHTWLRASNCNKLEAVKARALFMFVSGLRYSFGRYNSKDIFIKYATLRV